MASSPVGFTDLKTAVALTTGNAEKEFAAAKETVGEIRAAGVKKWPAAELRPAGEAPFSAASCMFARRLRAGSPECRFVKA
jgi:hypothetical protein